MKKVTFYSDEDLWKKFSAKILAEEGSTRKISKKLQNLMKDFLLESFFDGLLKDFNIETNYFISSSEIKSDRPTVNSSSAEVIREGRDSR